MSLARDERAALSDLFLVVGPDAPTRCEGWTTRRLASHLYERENDPAYAVSAFVSALASVADARMDALERRLPYAEVVARLRRGPGALSPLRLPALDTLANTTEYFVHHEDVRRGGGDATPRDLPASAQDELWKQVQVMGRLQFTQAPVGVVLERSGGSHGVLRAKPGSRTVTITGDPGELLLFLSGRRDVAHVELHGDDDAVADLLASTQKL